MIRLFGSVRQDRRAKSLDISRARAIRMVTRFFICWVVCFVGVFLTPSGVYGQDADVPPEHLEAHEVPEDHGEASEASAHSESESHGDWKSKIPNLTQHPVGYAMLVAFVLLFILVPLEHVIHIPKSVPMMLAAGILWALLATAVEGNKTAETAFNHTIAEYANILLFLLVAVTYIAVMRERNIFLVLKQYLIRKGYSYTALFWITGWLAFFISPGADNLTTSLIMASVIMEVAKCNRRFIAMCCVNIVNAANAGGVFSPAGDVTSLMAWAARKIATGDFPYLVLPALVMFLIPAGIMHFSCPDGKPDGGEDGTEEVAVKRGGFAIIGLFACTIFMAVMSHFTFHLPPVVGMMTGLSFLGIFAIYLKLTQQPTGNAGIATLTLTFKGDMDELSQMTEEQMFNLAKVNSGTKSLEVTPDEEDVDLFDMMHTTQTAFEADTFLFFFGIIMCVGALGFAGYLALLNGWLYSFGFTEANIVLGVVSALLDNIPVMFAVLGMSPDMPVDQWLLVTLTTGVGGSLLSVGSAAGVALMGFAVRKENGKVVEHYYTFTYHAKWIPVLALGFAASVATHVYLMAPLHRYMNGG